jgi:hypothetical protein
MAIVLLAAVVAAAGPAVYIVTLDDQGNNYYRAITGDDTGTLGEQTFIGNLPTQYNLGAGIGNFSNDEYYDFVLGTVSTVDSSKEIYLYTRNNNGNDFLGPYKVGEWSSGLYPADMAVASFDRKVFGNSTDDFVMGGYGSQNVGVYLNTGYDTNGNGIFASSDLEGASLYSVGADAADIDHDGNADVVVASTQGGIYLLFGNGDGTFRTPPVILGSTPYYGVTAVDFDGDSKVDLIATLAGDPSQEGGFDLFKGYGTGQFDPPVRLDYTGITGQSPVDNYDLNGDGYQDIVASNLVNRPYAVIAGLNDGTGQFTFSEYSGSGLNAGLWTIAAPPVFQNEAPIAVVTVRDMDKAGITINPEVQRIKTGTTLEFSDISSYDPEEKPLASDMIWWFEDGGSKTTNGENVTQTFNLPPGPSDVALTVTDNYGATATQTVMIHVNYPPIAGNDTYTTPKNNALTTTDSSGVLANDGDSEDNDPLTATLVTGTSHGTLTLDTEGSFDYTPVKDFVGTDTFTYKANDGVEDSDVATVTIGVTETPVWKVNIVPGVINLNSRGVFIAFITIPKPFKADDVQVDSVECEGATAERLIRIRHAKFQQVFGAVFKTSDLQDVKTGKHVKLTVKGKVLYNNELLDISGTDTVRVLTIKNRIKDDTEDYGKQNDKQLFEKFPGYREYSKDWDSSGHEGWNEGYDH